MRNGAGFVGGRSRIDADFANDDFPFAILATFVIPGLRGIFSIQATCVSPGYTGSSRVRNDKPGALKGSVGFRSELEGTTQAIKSPDDERVAWVRIPDRLVEFRAIGPGSGDDVAEDLIAAGGGQGINQQMEGLVPGRDPDVAKEHQVVFLYFNVVQGS
jgi:hypothetical protein